MMEDPLHNEEAPDQASGRHSVVSDLVAKLDAIALPFGLTMRHGLLILLGVIVLVGGILALMGGGFEKLTADSPEWVVDDGLTIQLAGEAEAGVRVKSILKLGQTARDALPAHLTPSSSFYEVETRGEGVVLLAFSPPASGNPIVYRWDEQAGEWIFVPSEIDLDSGRLIVDPVDGLVAVFQTTYTIPLISTTLEPDQKLNGAQAAAIDMLFVAGIEGESDGTLDSSLLDWTMPSSRSYAVLPVIRFSAPGTLEDVLADETSRAQHAASIIELVESDGFDGVLLDYGTFDAGLIEAFNQLVNDLALALHDQDQTLAVRVSTPTGPDPDWDTGVYDWAYLDEVSDMLVVELPGSPGDFHNGGLTDQFLGWAGNEVAPVKLHVAFTSLSIDEWAGQFNPIAYDYALTPLGMVAPAPGTIITHPEPGETLDFGFGGGAVDIGRDPDSGVYRYDIFAGDGEHRVWLSTAASLRDRLDWLAARPIGGAVVEDLVDEGNGIGTVTAVHEFKVNLPSSLKADLVINWAIKDASGNLLLETSTDLAGPLIWTPDEEGEYVISASLVGVETSDRGAVAVIVGGNNIGIGPSQEGVVEGAPGDDSVASDTTSHSIPNDLPPPVIPPATYGNFELGGQANHVVNHPDYMNQAGMTWVKFQLAWEENMDPRTAWDLIDRGREAGFKVLLSVPGQVKYPTDINIEAYLEFLRGVAYYGADAIEIWNEENLDFEWPNNQVNGGIYTREMLAPAYNAIKEVNPNTMVISGAPAPTGAFYADGGCSLQGYGCDDWLFIQQMAEAGAANYIDCVGVHYNVGATSPSAVTGHPGDPGYQHYSWYYGSMLELYYGTFGRPLCFTELGYLSGDGLGAVPDRFSWAAKTEVVEQAAWLAEAAQLSKASGRVRLMIVWNVDFVYWGDDPMAGYAIVRPDGSCPACMALGNVMNP